jgi:hypothetical protein
MTHRGISAASFGLIACFVCSTFGAAFAATNGPVTLDFTPFGTAHVASASMQLAPADRLFGRYQMSVVGIGNAISRYDGTTRLDDGPIAYAVVAIRDWEKRFPRDPWIARDLLYMQRVYERSHTGEGFTYAQHVAAWLQTDYPATEYAALSGRELVKSEAPPEQPNSDASHRQDGLRSLLQTLLLTAAKARSI